MNVSRRCLPKIRHDKHKPSEYLNHKKVGQVKELTRDDSDGSSNLGEVVLCEPLDEGFEKRRFTNLTFVEKSEESRKSQGTVG